LLIRFWGTRGSIPTPGSNTMRYGGNTSCVEVRSSEGTLLVLDCGTGSFALGQKLFADGITGLHGNILFSHTHWDHIQGFPFFMPVFFEGTEWDIYGPQGLNQSIAETLGGQMQYTYFPVNLDQLKASIRYHNLVEGTFQIKDIKITSQYLNHTSLTLGYRIEADGKTVVYSCDHEPYSGELAKGVGEIKGRDRMHAAFLANADLVIHDAQYTAEEYPEKVGWGHSTIEYVVHLCQHSGVKKLALTHHDPLRDDLQLDKIITEIREKLKKESSTLEVFAAAEGDEIQLGASKSAAPSDGLATKSALVDQRVLAFVKDPEIKKILLEAMVGQIAFSFAENQEGLIQEVKKASLILIEHDPPAMNALTMGRSVTEEAKKNQLEIPLVGISAKQENLDATRAAGIAEWLLKPFSSSYSRYKIQTWLNHSNSRWVRAPIPENEEERLKVLKSLNLLDTKEEDRFDKFTKIIASIFDVPYVLISLVDKDRQWFKSHHGIDVRETSREKSICSHVVYNKKMLIVPDTLKDDRFAENPDVIEGPHIRFYAGFPLNVEEGSIIGTLCLLDKRPRDLNSEEVKLIEDFRDLLLLELKADKKLK